MYILLMPDYFRTFQSFEDEIILKLMRDLHPDERENIRIVQIKRKHAHSQIRDNMLVLFPDGSYFLASDDGDAKVPLMEGKSFFIDSSSILTGWQYDIRAGYGVMTEDGKEGRVVSRHFFSTGLQYQVQIRLPGGNSTKVFYKAEALFPPIRKTRSVLSDETIQTLAKEAVRLWLA